MTALFIVSDIFGKTSALERLGETLGSLTNSNVDIIEPYDGKMMGFTDEQSAYHYFSDHVGLTTYTEQLQDSINACAQELILIGFSIGTSAIWQLSQGSNNVINQRSVTNNGIIQTAIGFYGSQIRHQLEIIPTFPIELIYPKSELHFSVTDLMNKLRDKEQLTLTQVDYLHGFMNRHSTNFNQQGYQCYCDLLADKINRVNA